MGFIEAGGSRVADMEPHEELADVGSGLQQGLVMDEEAWARSAFVESEFVGLFEANKFGEGDLGLPRNVVRVPTRGRHVEAGCEWLCGPIAEVGSA